MVGQQLPPVRYLKREGLARHGVEGSAHPRHRLEAGLIHLMVLAHEVLAHMPHQDLADEEGADARWITEIQGMHDAAFDLDGRVREWPQPAIGSAKNYGYAFQWGAMFILILGLHVYFYIRRRAQARAS